MKRIRTWRYNPTSGDLPWILGGAVLFGAGLALLARSRPAQAQSLPVTRPTPVSRPTQPTVDMTFTPEEALAIGHSLVRQTNPPTESVRSTRIVQQQLQDLGYAITRTDGQQSEETNRAVARFIAVNGLPETITPVDLMRAIDAEYVRVFGERGYV